MKKVNSMKEYKKSINRSDKFCYTDEDIKGIKITKAKKSVKESYSSFAEFLFEKEEVPFNDKTMRWITIKDERDRNQHILIKKKDGTVIAGMGGEHNGKKLDQAFKDIADDKEDLNKKEEPNHSQLITKTPNSGISLDKKNLKKYISEFKKTCVTGANFHKTHNIQPKINEDAQWSIIEYTGPLFKFINRILRDPDGYKEYYDFINDFTLYYNHIDNIHKALKENKTEENVIAYRGVKGILMEQLTALEPGDIFTDSGFSSTSTNKEQAEKFAYKDEGGYVMTILIPKGSQAASVKKLTAYKKEEEILINKNCRFKIIDINHKEQEIVMELLPHKD